MERIKPSDLPASLNGTTATNSNSTLPTSPTTATTECPDCGGVGWFSRGVVPFGQSPIEPCHCTIERQQAREAEAKHAHQASLSARLTREMCNLATCSLESFDLRRSLEELTWQGKTIDVAKQRNALKGAYATCRAYADHPGGWLYL